MIPYILVEPIRIGGVTLHPFGFLVVIAVVLGTSLAVRRAKRLGLDENELRSFVGWILVPGFVGAHVLDALFYSPRLVVEDPWMLLRLWAGIGSFGGFAGATLGAIAWKYYTTKPVLSLGWLGTIVRPVRRAHAAKLLSFADVVLAVFPVSWIFGRAGCAVAHDHPGHDAARASWWTVEYGPGPVSDFGLFQLRHGNQPRYDLGLLEMFFAMALAAAFALTWRGKHRTGVYVVATCLAYAPVRFLMDFLRAPAGAGGDARYASLTPAQWSCFALFAGGILLARHVRAAGRVESPA